MTPLRLESSNFRDRRRYRRALRITGRGHALATALCSLPAATLPGLVLYRIGAMIGCGLEIVLVAAWLLSGLWWTRPTALLEINGATRVYRGTTTGTRKLFQAWREVASAAGVRATKYTMWVQHDRDIRATAVVGRSAIVVSSAALAQLTRAELQGVLGHELGHHLTSAASRWLELLTWYSRPLMTVIRLPRRWRTWYLKYAVRHEPSRIEWIAGRYLALITAAGVAVCVMWSIGLEWSIVFGILLVVQGVIRLLLHHHDEYRADRVSVDLGFGPGLRTCLVRAGDEDAERMERWGFTGPMEAKVVLSMEALLGTHPLIEKRIRVVDSRIRARDAAGC
ncbi:M48 family metalloprotease [Nocardia jejuensis]|uniref:M48 family metalloprotease n=1 Tax=Nocardia jejuensis TaxID=328049 RepID=UPI00082B9F20|nr:M48 family metalloprotease [Nocardia jejuensis]